MKTFLRTAFLTLPFICWGFVLSAQVSYHQGPSNEIKKLFPQIAQHKNGVHEILLTSPQSKTDVSSENYGTAVPMNMPLSRSKDLAESKSSSWMIHLKSPNVLSLNFVITNIAINETTKIYIYDEELTIIFGPIETSNINKANKLISTIIFPSNSVYIEVFEPTNVPSSTFTLAQVTHGFSERILPRYSQTNPRARTATDVSCIPDITCQYGWDNEREMVGYFVTNGKAGTGTFVNNEALNRRPFFLSAFHVADTQRDHVLRNDELNAINYCSVRIDYRTNTCNGAVNFGTTFSGAIPRAWYDVTDFILIELYQTPAIAQLVNFAGWTTSTSSPNKGTSLHHPDSQNMRYSTSTNGGVRQHPTYGEFWQVSNWDMGVVAGGSSGCALFNEYHQVVGQLFGGLSSCTFMDLQDRYGKFSESWYGGNTTDSQLKAWLSPTQNLSSMSHLLPLTINGGSTVCYNTNLTLTMPYLLANEAATWSVSGNISIVSSTANSITIKASYAQGSGYATVIADFGNGVQATKSVYYGAPDVYSITYDNNQSAGFTNSVSPNTQHNVYLDLNNAIAANITSVNWNPNPYIGYSYGQYNASYNFTLNPGDVLYFNPLSATNQCGTEARSLSFSAYSSFRAYPNPSTTKLTVEFNSTKYVETLPYQINLISETAGKTVKSINVEETFNKRALVEGNKIIFNVQDLPRGRYYLQFQDKKSTNITDPVRIILIDN